ncbi:hypothetical protein A2U01_0020601 [Trifolium medium]|uniref:Uncharacterized protein n=1 Tax=Trifolium medium TaxID=97028 RepID=A0A392NI83_9FABA|nr:hypothetical protein [Trifolium medium]
MVLGFKIEKETICVGRRACLAIEEANRRSNGFVDVTAVLGKMFGSVDGEDLYLAAVVPEIANAY